MGKRYFSYKSNFHFFLNGPHKITFVIFEILKIETFNEFYSFSLTWDPMGVKVSKRYCPQIASKSFKILLNFPPNCPHKVTLGIFDSFENLKYLESERS